MASSPFSLRSRPDRLAATLAFAVAPLPSACARPAPGATAPAAHDVPTATPADVAAAPEPADPPRESTQPSPQQSSLTTPAPDATLVPLPTDVRLPDRSAWQTGYRKDCKALAASPCELTGDLDGDGVPEHVVQTRSERSKHAGIAVLWGSGAVSIIGAGTPSRQLRTEVFIDSVALEWSAVEDDLSFVTRWAVVQRSADGFVARGPGAERSLPAPMATGAGIWLDGGDAAEVLYWDGTQWRRLVVGF
jgi:hypothetical protein